MTRWKPSLLKDSCLSVSTHSRANRVITHLLVHVQLPEYLGRIEEMLVVDDLLRIPRQQR